ncbi:MAG: hypothetical protein ACK5TN_10695 [Acidobacteriota bacterium]
MLRWILRIFGFGEKAPPPIVVETETAAQVREPMERHIPEEIPAFECDRGEPELPDSEAAEAVTPAPASAIEPRPAPLRGSRRPGLFAPAYRFGRPARPRLFLSPDMIVAGFGQHDPGVPEAFLETTPESDPAPTPDPPSPTDDSLHVLLTNYLLFAEADPMRMETANHKFLRSNRTRALAVLLRDQILAHWQSAGAPLAPMALFRMAESLAESPQEALHIAYAATRAFGDGGMAIPWRQVNRSKGIYSTGLEVFALPAQAAEEGILPCLFDASLSPDRADWWRYFAAALLCLDDDGVGRRRPAPDWYLAIRDRYEELRADAGVDPGWAWANAVFSYESSRWARIPTRVVECHRAARAGALLGGNLRTNARTGDWMVPAVAGAKQLRWTGE